MPGTHGAALLLAAAQGLSIAEAALSTCAGTVNIAGHGLVQMTNAQWNVPGQGAGNVMFEPIKSAVAPLMKGRTYFADTCIDGTYNNTRYTNLKLLGKTLKWTTNTPDAGCGCNAALYLVSMYQNPAESMCYDFYCDANNVCGERCEEVDLQESNEWAWHSTLHSAQDGGGVATGCGGGGSQWSGPRTWSLDDYSPGSKCIDTSKPFQAEASFPVDKDGDLISMDIKLSQGNPPCSVNGSVGVGYKGLKAVSNALKAGMVPVISYWSSSTMTWMDGVGKDGLGHCVKDDPKQCPIDVQFYNFSIFDIGSKEPALLEAAPVKLPEALAELEEPVPELKPAELDATRYEFVGTSNQDAAHDVCGAGKQIAMPKTKAQKEALLDAIAAQESSALVATMPPKSVWLGASWNKYTDRWLWDDGSDASALDTPTIEDHLENLELTLIMTPDGEVMTAEPALVYGVFCQLVEPDTTVPRGDEFCCLEGKDCDSCGRRAGFESTCGTSESVCSACGDGSMWCKNSRASGEGGFERPEVSNDEAPVLVEEKNELVAPAVAGDLDARLTSVLALLALGGLSILVATAFGAFKRVNRLTGRTVRTASTTEIDELLNEGALA